MRFASNRRGVGLRLIVALGAASTVLGCVAPPLAPGDPLDLAEGEGFLVIHTESPWDIDTLGFGLGKEVLEIPAGTEVRLMRLPEGEYHWDDIKVAIFDFDLPDEEHWQFRVEAGKVNYPGQVTLTVSPFYGAYSRNRSAEMLDGLEDVFPGLLGRYEFVYTGHDRDDWLAEYSHRRMALDRAPTPQPPIDVAAVLLVDAEARGFFRPAQTKASAISPDGRYVATHADALLDREKVVIHRLDTGASARVLRKHAIDRMYWVDEDSLLVTRAEGNDVVDIEEKDDGFTFAVRTFSLHAQLVDTLPLEDDVILVGIQDEDPVWARVHRIHLSQIPEDRFDLGEGELGEPVASLASYVDRWVTDANGDVRAAVTVRLDKDPILRLVYREDVHSRWRVLARGRRDEMRHTPVGFTRDGMLLVATDAGRETQALYEFDPKRRKLTNLIYEHPAGEIEGVVFDYSGADLLGVAVFESGERRYRFFDRAADEHIRAAQNTFPGKRVHVSGFDRDRRVFTALVESEQDPGEHFVFDVERGTADSLGPVAPWIRRDELGIVELVTAESDGFTIEGFLTLPTFVERPPLVVVPHGGPIGVRDQLGFDPVAQFLASSGLAVLQVNFRGSEGYGRSFREAGKGQYGTGIETDIEAMVSTVIAGGKVDPERLCIAGGSYGGFSALRSAILFPDRYRCAATLAGVTDLPLVFNLAGHAALREWLRTAVGDPEAHYGDLRERSPVYGVEDLQVPVHLVHGRLDPVVDLEHALRMKRMLELHDRDFDWAVYDGAGHGFASSDQETHYYWLLQNFLWKHLEEAADGSKASGAVESTKGD